jgi:Protein of unknown function (DUF1643)
MVDTSLVAALFVNDKKHRAKLCLPYAGRKIFRSLCVIGQNPSDANEKFADKTVRYLEELIYKNYPQYSQLVILNLFSRVDKYKSETCYLLDEECERVFETTLKEHEDILFVHGQLKIDGAYNFPQRLNDIRHLLKGKAIWKLDIGKMYAPHPRNKAINFKNFDVTMCAYDFSDVLP